MSVAQAIRDRLEGVLSPCILEIVDQSDLHYGHSGWREGGQTHFHIVIVSDAFEGLSRVERHRRVNDILKLEIGGSVHALSLRTLTFSESAE